MDANKKRYLDDIMNTQIVPDLDIDIQPFLDFFETEEGSWYLDHRSRFVETYVRLCRNIALNYSWKIAETGELSGVSEFLRKQGYNVTALTGDFRYDIDRPDDSLDLLISLEVLEHIKDQDTANFDELVNFNFSGSEKFVAEIWRCVRPGGFVVLSTPNACSLINLSRLLEYEAPMMFWPHVKEYPPAEVIRRFEDRGFVTRHWETFFGLFHLDNKWRSQLLTDLFTQRAASAEHRGDIGFFVFEKPLTTHSQSKLLTSEDVDPLIARLKSQKRRFELSDERWWNCFGRRIRGSNF
jgi:SAM-dependent methyltransferase